MAAIEGNGVTRREFEDIRVRLRELEEGEKGVLANRIKAVESRLAWQTTALFGAAISFLLMALTIALTVRGGG